MTVTDEPLVISKRRAAALLDVSTRQVDRLVRAGVLAPVRLIDGGHVKFRVRDIAALVGRDNEEE